MSNIGAEGIYFTAPNISGVEINTNTPEESAYSGAGPMDIMIPCIRDDRGLDCFTRLNYGVLVCGGPKSDQGEVLISTVTSGPGNNEIQLGHCDVTRNGALIYPNSIGIYTWDTYPPATIQIPRSSLHLTWQNPNNVDWKLTLYRTIKTETVK
jgi:hypothetical protein